MATNWFSGWGGGQGPPQREGPIGGGPADPNFPTQPQHAPQQPLTMEQMMQVLGASVLNTNQTVGYLAQTLQQNAGGSAGSGSQGYRALKPKKELVSLSADNARTLMTELMQFEVDLGELGVAVTSEAAYRQLRAMCF